MIEEVAAVRAFTKQKINDFESKKAPIEPVFSERILVFDTETTTDLYQNLKFGYFEIYFHDIFEHGGIFYYPEILNTKEKSILIEYGKNNNIPIYTIDEFRDLFLKETYDLKTNCVGFNLPFDLTRIAIKSTNARFRRKNGFSLLFSNNLCYPRLIITHVTSTFSFIEWGNTKSKQKRFKGNFLDLRTLCHALTDKKFDLESACKAFDTEYKKYKVKEHGKITPEYIQYCINDVKSTYSLYKNAKKEFDSYDIDLPITQAYTPASIGKSFLKMMGIKPFFKQNPKFSNEILGKIMTCYFGGKTEDKIRKTPTKVDVLDFLSMYPTVCILQKLWRFVIADHIEYKEETEKITKFIDSFRLEDIQNKENWTRLQGICLIEPNEDVLPLRAKYGEKNVWNIGVNYVISKTPLWYSIADVIASKLYTKKTPKILKAYYFIPVGIQKGLKSINIHGITINPYKQDLFKELIEYRKRLQKKSDSKQQVIKIIANAISYGIFVEIVTLEELKKIPVNVYGLEHFTQQKKKIEKTGFMFNPIIAISITSASRLLLATTEVLLSRYGVTHAYCDTDSMAIPAKYTKKIQKFFQPLNPYNFDAEIFKLEKSNVWFYGISAKRYCLYTIKNNQIKIEDDDYSSHGLGHLLDPFSNNTEKKNNWHIEIWKDILDLHYGNLTTDQLMQKYENKFALAKFVISNPRILNRLEKFNKNKDYQHMIKPFNFSILGFSNAFNEENGKLIKPLAPFRRPARHAVYNYFVDYNDKSRGKLQGKQYWKSFWDTFWDYLNHNESKFDGETGILERKHVNVNRVLHIGKESNNLDEAEYLGVDANSYETYEDLVNLDTKFKEISNAILDLTPKDVKKLGISKQTLWNAKKSIKYKKIKQISNKTKLRLLAIS